MNMKFELLLNESGFLNTMYDSSHQCQTTSLPSASIHAKCWGVQHSGERTYFYRWARNSQTVSNHLGGFAHQPPLWSPFMRVNVKLFYANLGIVKLFYSTIPLYLIVQYIFYF